MTTTSDPVAARMLARTTVHTAPRRGLDSAALDAFDAYQRRRNFSPKTLHCRRAVLAAFGRHLGGGLVVASRRDVEEWLDSVELGPQGRYTYLAHLHAFYRYALREAGTQGKGKKDRVLPAHPRTLEALRAYGLPQEGPVFVRDGRARTPDEVGARIAQFFAEHGIAGTPHSLRHTFGTTVYQRSRDLLLTQRLMGHSSLQTVMGYVALNPDGRDVDVVRGLGE